MVLCFVSRRLGVGLGGDGLLPFQRSLKSRSMEDWFRMGLNAAC